MKELIIPGGEWAEDLGQQGGITPLAIGKGIAISVIRSGSGSKGEAVIGQRGVYVQIPKVQVLQGIAIQLQLNSVH